jgi:phosphoserine phosphatase RsbU/P
MSRCYLGPNLLLFPLSAMPNSLPNPRQGLKVLVVEDDAVSRKILQTSLEKSGHDVVLATNGQEAWASFDKEPVRMIVSDWMMPEMDGLSLCRNVRQRPETDYTYFILLTARSGKDNYHLAMDAGIDDFLSKPLDRRELTIRMRVAERILGYTTRIRQLEKLLPICSYCKNIRDEKDEWHPVEEYINHQTHAELSHGICPSCYETRMKPMLEELKRKKHAKTP